MKFMPKKLVNRKSRVVEFFYNHQVYSFRPGEVKLLPGEVADHALRFVNTGLVEVTEELEKELKALKKKQMPDYENMPWAKLVKRARGNFRPGMKKAEIVEMLKKRWVKRYGK